MFPKAGKSRWISHTDTHFSVFALMVPGVRGEEERRRGGGEEGRRGGGEERRAPDRQRGCAAAAR